MNERHRRGGRRQHESYRDSRGSNERQFGRDEPWREEQGNRYPNERYGGERQRSYSASGGTRGYQDRGGSRGYGPDRGRQSAYGHGYGYGFSDSSSYRQENQPGRRSESYGRGDDRQWSGGGYAGGGGQWERDRDRERDDRWDRDRMSGGFGSEYGAWRSGASFGFGPEEGRGRDTEHESWQGSPYGTGDMNTDRAGQGGFEDVDWMPTRPARGRGSWGGDWSIGRTGAGEYGSQYGGSYNRADFSGRGPKDYRRSDDRIREEICDRLTDDSEIDASDVSIKVESGEVTLTGFVNSRDQKRRAEELAERISGAREVVNQLRVSRGETGSQQISQSQQSQQPGARGQRASSTTQPSSVAADRDR